MFTQNRSAPDQRRVVSWSSAGAEGGRISHSAWGKFGFTAGQEHDKQVGIPGGYPRQTWVLSGQVEHHADLAARQRQFTINHYRFGVRQR